MKKEFFDAVLQVMRNNKDVYLLLGDLGYPRYDELKKEFPDRVYTLGASEQTLLDCAVGLAYAQKIPFVYTITPFLYRGFETIRTYINHEKLNVKLCGAGRDDDYSKDDGFSHDAGDISAFFDNFTNITSYWPDTKEEIPDLVNKMVELDKPQFISLRR